MLSTHSDALCGNWNVGNGVTSPTRLSEADASLLLDLAQRSVRLGVEGELPLQPIAEHYSCPLRRLQSTFVTLRDRSGVISRAGTVQPTVPLVSDVCHNAYEVATHAVERIRSTDLVVDVQLVSPLQYLSFQSLESVLQQLKPEEDGVFLQLGLCQATFTPDKWQQWPDADGFFRALQCQAGIDPDEWSSERSVATYHVTQLPQSEVVGAHAERPSKPK